MTETLRTYEEWNKWGYYVIKGSKAIEFNGDRVALFSSRQVLEKCLYDYGNEDYNNVEELY